MTEINKQEVLLSGKVSFSLEVPYRLYRSGSADVKQPLYVYLQENGKNITYLEETTKPLRNLPGYHLLIQAPYPGIKSNNKTRKYYWIPDFKDAQKITAAREYVSEFLQEVIDGILPYIEGNRLVLVGWANSSGQVSYFCATRPHYINELILFGGSVDRTWMEPNSGRYRHLRVLGLSGKDATISDEITDTIYRWIYHSKPQ